MTKALTIDSNLIINEVNSVAHFLTPIEGDKISGVNQVIIDSLDHVSVKSVVVTVDNLEIAHLTQAPFSFSWDTAQFADGLTQLSAIAVDSCGNQTNVSLFVTIENRVPLTPVDMVMPMIELLSPVDGGVLSGTVPLMVDISDDIAVDRVIYRIDQEDIATTVFPYAFDWNTQSFSDGVHQLSVVVIDTSNNIASLTVSVIVGNVAVACASYSRSLPHTHTDYVR